MHAHDIVWDFAEPSAFGSPHYLRGTYRGCEIETHFTGGAWEWAFYDAKSPDPELAVTRSIASEWREAVREAKDYIDGHVAAAIQARLEYLRGEIEAERISYGEIAELESLAEHISGDDTLLLQWANVPEEEGNAR